MNHVLTSRPLYPRAKSLKAIAGAVSSRSVGGVFYGRGGWSLTVVFVIALLAVGLMAVGLMRRAPVVVPGPHAPGRVG